MLKTDLHMHTINSHCGHHTPLEVMRLCKDRGLEMIALTDHGPECGGAVRGSFYDERRFLKDYEGMVVLKGMECNAMNTGGDIDAPRRLIAKMDIVLAGLHPFGYTHNDMERNTEAAIGLTRNKWVVDLITHPDQRMYPIDLNRLVPAAVERGVALELNNSGVALGKCDPERTAELVRLGRRHGALFALNSDAHTWVEYGNDDAMRDFLRRIDAPPLDIINDWPVDKILEHLEGRRRDRRRALDAA